MSRPQVAVFRPDDSRLSRAVEVLEGFGVAVITDPMLAVEATGRVARTDAEFVVLTSASGVRILAEADWTPGEMVVCAIGRRTARACEEVGFDVDVVPDTYSSEGLVAVLRDRVDGARVEVARSDHGSDVLLDGITAAGGYVHETVLYTLVRPEGSGESVVRIGAGEVDGVLFTSSLTVTNLLAAATDQGMRDAVVRGLNDAVVGAIGDPTRETASGQGITVDVVPREATFASLARAVSERLCEAPSES